VKRFRSTPPEQEDKDMATKFHLSAIATAIGLSFFCTTGMAQTYPTRPIRLVLPYSPGGIVDFVGRAVGHQLSDILGQPIVPENRPGAGGVVGTETVSRAQPDGYTLLVMDPAIVINPTLLKSVGYDLFKQLDAISVISSSPLVLVATPELKVKTFKDFVAYGKANPDTLNYASAGIGTTPHLAGELFKQRTGIEATHVPYKGIASSYPDLMSNKVQFAFSSITGALPFTGNNSVIALATTGERRSPVYPDKPTVVEEGLNDFTVDLWVTIFVPAGTPPDIEAKLNAAIKTALGKPELKDALAKFGIEPRGTSQQEGAAFVKAEYEKWKQVIVTANVKTE
jgi:tripartite-type tricarboxylate transporter receptor subunit TctC